MMMTLRVCVYDAGKANDVILFHVMVLFLMLSLEFSLVMLMLKMVVVQSVYTTLPMLVMMLCPSMVLGVCTYCFC